MSFNRTLCTFPIVFAVFNKTTCTFTKPQYLKKSLNCTVFTKECRRCIHIISYNLFFINFLENYLNVISQCTPGIFNLDQNFHGLSCFGGLHIHETVQNQSRKRSVIRLLKFTIVKMIRKFFEDPSFRIENFFFEDYCFGSLMTDVFLD